LKKEILLICLGNQFRRDDGVGHYIASHAVLKNAPIQIIENSSSCIELLDSWNKKKLVILVDAVKSGSHPGTIFRLESLGELDSFSIFPFSTHAVGLAECIALSKTLNLLPSDSVFFGIEGKDFGFGTELTDGVKNAAERLVAEIVTLCDNNNALH
jgi:hydrogenase maturation protease